jgi:hypothetical protein
MLQRVGHGRALEARATLLWRESPWHCEAGCVRWQWIAHLYLDDVIVAEWPFDGISPMLRTAHRWHAAVKKDNSGSLLMDELKLQDW